MDLKNVVATKLRELMDSRPDLNTQQKIAEATGFSQSSIGRVLNAEVETNLGVIQSLARAFSVPPAHFLEEMHRPQLPLSVGAALAQIASALQHLPDAKRELIAAAVSSMMNGQGRDYAEAIDALAGPLYLPPLAQAAYAASSYWPNSSAPKVSS